MRSLRKQYTTLVTLLTSAFATVLSTSMVRIATPYIQQAFSLRYADLTWIHNAYQISYAVLMPVRSDSSATAMGAGGSCSSVWLSLVRDRFSAVWPGTWSP